MVCPSFRNSMQIRMEICNGEVKLLFRLYNLCSDAHFLGLGIGNSMSIPLALSRVCPATYQAMFGLFFELIKQYHFLKLRALKICLPFS